MSETLSSTIIIIIYLLASALLHLAIVKSKSFVIIAATVVIHFIGTWYYIVFLNYFINIERMKGVYLGFGHANFDLFGLMGLCYLIAVVNSSVAIWRRYRKK
jgi:hypothetical protein